MRTETLRSPVWAGRPGNVVRSGCKCTPTRGEHQQQSPPADGSVYGALRGCPTYWAAEPLATPGYRPSTSVDLLLRLGPRQCTGARRAVDNRSRQEGGQVSSRHWALINTRPTSTRSLHLFIAPGQSTRPPSTRTLCLSRSLHYTVLHITCITARIHRFHGTKRNVRMSWASISRFGVLWDSNPWVRVKIIILKLILVTFYPCDQCY